MATRMRRHPLALVVAGIVALSSPVLLTGCSLIPNPVEGILEGVTGGEVQLPGQSVPQDFPAEVPLVEGQVVFGAGIGNDSERVWNVMIDVGADAPERIAAQLEDAGFTSGPGAQLSGSVGTLIYGKGELGVLVLVTEGDSSGRYVANYTVTRGVAQ